MNMIINKNTGKLQPTVINEELLLGAVKEQVAQHKAEPIASFNEVLKLHLEHKNILKIESLWEFTSLVRLDLNNNFIDNIQGLERLINLTWLNLSFNRLKKIEGLESLQKLEVLNLSNNKISVIENMDALENLTHFLIANNLLQQLDKVLYLRKFKKLVAVCLCGNPASNEDSYKLFIAAYFPKLVFLDWRIIDEKTRNEASVKYLHVLEKIRHEELQKQQAEEAQQHQEAELKLHKDAYVEFLNGPCFFKSMFEDDPEAETLQRVPEVASLFQTFEHQMVALCMQLFEIGLTEHKCRETEVNCFFSGQSEAKTDYQQKESQMLANFDQEHKKRIAEIQQLSDPDILEAKINHCNDEINQLSKSLMTMEFQLVKQSEDNVRKFDTIISEMVGNFSATVQGIFAQCRDLEDNYYQKVQEAAIATLKKVSKDELDEEMPDDVITLFTDKDKVMDALITSHDNHMVKINDRETQLVTQVSTWKETLIREIQGKELQQNRMHISDILRYMDHLREQLEVF